MNENKSPVIYDIAIFGGGPAGYNAAEKAALQGFRVVLFEKQEVGGVCLNEGCIPTKALLYSAKLLDGMRTSEKYGLHASTISFDQEKILQRKYKVVKKLTSGVTYKLTSGGVTLIQGQVTIEGEGTGGYIRITCNSEQSLTRYILLCTGSSPVIPPIKGLEKSGYWTSKQALEATVLPNSLTIIGGGVIGMEFASYFNTLGVKVTVVEMMPKILGNMDKEISGILQSEYTKKGVKFHLNSKVTEVKEHSVVIEKNGEQIEIPGDKILVSVGRKANMTDIGLEKLGIDVTKNGVTVNRFMQTNHPQVYAAGDITGFSMLAHTAIREGEVAVNHILGLDDEMSYRATPAVLYTNPEAAGVGSTEEELAGKGAYYRVLKLPMTYSGRFVVENEGINGLCKLLVDEQNHIVGCHIVGNAASELAVIAGIAIEEQFTVEQFRKIVFPHPTVGEIIREVLFE